MSSKKLLLIEPFTALPQTSGGRTRIFHTIDKLNKYFDLTVWSFLANEQELSLQKNWLKKLNIPYQHFITQKKKFFSFISSGQPYWFSDWWNKDLIETLKNEAPRFDSIQIESTQLLYLSAFLKKHRHKIFVAYDVSSISFWRRLRSENNLLKKLLHFFRLIEVYLYELRYLPFFDLVIAMSETDKNILRKLFGIKNIEIIENGVEHISLLPTREKSDIINLGLIGSFSHPPNLEAFRFCCEKILPLLEKNNVEFKFYLAGENDGQLVKNMSQKLLKDPAQVVNLGFVKEATDFYQQIDVLIAPLFAGSGTRIKILESLSFGKPVITTETGAEGIAISDPWVKKIKQLKANDAQLWLNSIRDLMSRTLNQEDYLHLNTKLQKLTWDKIMKTHAYVLHNLGMHFTSPK